MSLRERLAGRRVLLTGVTGFVGEALLERLLSDLPDTSLVVLVRSRGSRSARDRVEQLLAKPAFAGLRERLGADGVAGLLAQRVTVLEGDLADVPAMPADVDVVVHCAGEVSFDPPIDEGFRTNLLGTKRLVDALRAAGARPHYVHVSTAYVAGLRKGPQGEHALDHHVDWRAECDAALRLRATVEDASRTPDRLARFTREAEKQHRRAGPLTVAEDAEHRRHAWVAERLVAAGRERARTLGWTDCYTFTKALTERMVEQEVTDWPVTILRPSIIESALARPYPGWIEGFKMAEPLILAFGRGALPEFPATPESTLDVIPVDLVVNALVAAAAEPPQPGTPAYLHVCSGARNPLTFRRTYELVREYFQAHPFVERDRGAIKVPEWRFPGPDRVETMLRTAERAAAAVNTVVSRLPASPALRTRLRDLDRFSGQLEFQRRYADLYRPYTAAEVHFTDEHTLALHQRLDPADREAFGFDVAVVDWTHYLRDVHCPAVTAPMRAARPRRAPTAPGRTGELPARTDVVAAFDMDGTLLASNVVEGYLWLRLADTPAAGRLRELADVARSVPGFLAADRRDRGQLLRAVYRRYDGADVEELDRIVDTRVADLVLARLAPEAVRRIRRHRAAGHRTVLVTGAVAPLTRPLRPLFDEIVAVQLAEQDGRYTGFLAAPPVVGEARAAWLRRYAAGVGADLKASYAYADSHTDLPMLRAVGHPVAVNPDVALTRYARGRRWPIEEWQAAGGTSRLRLPEPVS